MAASPVEKTKHEINQSGGEESDENEAEKSLDDFLRDTNELVTSTTQDDAKSPASSDDMDGEFVIPNSALYWVLISRDTVLILCAVME